MSDTEWTAERIAQLRALWAEGHSSTEIARRLSTSKNAIVGKAHRLQLPARPSPIRTADPARVAKPKAPRPAPLPPGARTLQPTGNAGRTATPAALTTPPPSAKRRGECRWPIGEVGSSGFRFCCAELATGTRMPYCAEHAAKARAKPEASAA